MVTLAGFLFSSRLRVYLCFYFLQVIMIYIGPRLWHFKVLQLWEIIFRNRGNIQGPGFGEMHDPGRLHFSSTALCKKRKRGKRKQDSYYFFRHEDRISSLKFREKTADTPYGREIALLKYLTRPK